MRHLPLAIAVVAIEAIILYLFFDITKNIVIIEGQIDWFFVSGLLSLALIQSVIFSKLVTYGKDTVITIVYEDEDE